MDQLEMVALMSSNHYRWRCKITPITRTGTSHGHAQPNKSQSSKVQPRGRARRSIENVNLETNFIGEHGDDAGDMGMSLENPLITSGYNTTSFEVPWQASFRTILKDHVILNQTEQTTSRYSETTKASTNETDPLQAQRQCYLEDGMHFCGGIIISDRHILSAAHCFYATSKMADFIPPEDVRVVLGDTNRCTNDSHVQQNYQIDSITLHYAYDNVGIINDVAVVKLKRPISFKRNIQKIKMASPKENFEGMRASISGWGLQNLTEENNGTAESPLILALNDRFIIQNQSECNAEQIRYIGQSVEQLAVHPKYEHILESVICTETFNPAMGRAHVGQGDSGGPVVVKSKTGENIVVGIVSHSVPNEDPLNVEEPKDFFASVAFYRNWIDLAIHH
ncbi:unnamed protein product [Allacma fusca]|uniref:Peptidase S1 domain-containing protein n=1 Tax=Allacma fusca TaxID=39272 RepID=A0A8J2NZM4_9HEXA|nr:unnamed protein product [Allacma fusca]